MQSLKLITALGMLMAIPAGAYHLLTSQPTEPIALPQPLTEEVSALPTLPPAETVADALLTVNTIPPAPTLSLSSTAPRDTLTTAEINQRFIGLLSHVHWLIENQPPSPATPSITDSSLRNQVNRLERQIFRSMDDDSDGRSRLRDDLTDGGRFAEATLTSPTLENAILMNPTITDSTLTIIGVASINDISFGQGADLNNTLFGEGTMLSNMSGTFNTAFGNSTLYSNTSGSQNTAVGNAAISSLLSGIQNTAYGYNALRDHISGDRNVAIGPWAMTTNGPEGNSGNENVALGFSALGRHDTGSGNTGLGYRALEGVTTGSYNIGVGYRAGDKLGLTGTGNIIIGYNVDAPTLDANNQLNIGNLIFGTALDGRDNTLSSGNVGIGTTTPTAKLEVAGGIKTWGQDNALFLGTGGVTHLGFGWNNIGTYHSFHSSGPLNDHLALSLQNPTAQTLTIKGHLDVTQEMSVGYTGLSSLTVPAGGFVVAGNVGVGTTSPSEKLTVVGNVYASSFIDDGITLNAPDYVFDDPGYFRLSLEEIESFTEENYHLPWLTPRGPGPMSLSERINEILEALENLFLHVFDLAKRLLVVEDKISEQDKKDEELEAEIEALKAQDDRIADLEAKLAELSGEELAPAPESEVPQAEALDPETPPAGDTEEPLVDPTDNPTEDQTEPPETPEEKPLTEEEPAGDPAEEPTNPDPEGSEETVL